MNSENNHLLAYLNLSKDEFKKRTKKALEALKNCQLCPRACKVDRLNNEIGFCKTGRFASVSSTNIHTGEEPPISGTKGSGTIFFSHCNLKCKFCQNYPISQLGVGNKVSKEELAKMMLNLQNRGAHNINLVTPSHIVPQFIEGLELAVEQGLNIPIVYNSSGYEGISALKLLDGIVDIYMPDIKYFSDEHAIYCSNAPKYFEFAKIAIKEMYRQVGDFDTDENGIGIKGLLIRHLVLPNGLSDEEEIFKFISEKLGTNVPVNLMSQYFPADSSKSDKSLNRKITKEEYNHALKILKKYGLDNGWIQPL